MGTEDGGVVNSGSEFLSVERIGLKRGDCWLAEGGEEWEEGVALEDGWD